MPARPPPQGPRQFTVEEANALVPELEMAFGRLARLRAEAGLLVKAFGGAEPATAFLRGAPPPPGLEVIARQLRVLVSAIEGVVEQVNGLGCLVKDVDAGLVDFHGVVAGEPVYLCWQFGEPAVAHWHPIEGGFAERRPIEGVTVHPPTFLN